MTDVTATKTTTELDNQPTRSLEERLQPWIDQGEYIIILTLVIMAWSAGWVDLLSLVVSDSDSLAFSSRIIAIIGFIPYTLAFFLWFWLIRSLSALDRLKHTIAWVQRRPLVFVASLGLFVAITYSMLIFEEWVRLPLLQVVILFMMTLFLVAVLLTKPVPDTPFQPWRKFALAGVALLFILEASLQGLAFVGTLELNTTRGLLTPYGRVYQSDEGLGNGITNSNGWYYPEPRLEEGNYRILLSGDTFIQALQIPMDEHMGLQLEELIDDEDSEVIAQGHLGYGPTQFMHPIMWSYIWEPVYPDEMVIFFHLVNDFQVVYDDKGRLPRSVLDEDGYAVIHDDDFANWHDLAHFSIKGYDPPNPIRTILSHSFSVALLREAVDDEPFIPKIRLNIEEVTEEQPFGPATFIFESSGNTQAEQAFAIAAGQLKNMVDEMSKHGITVRLVTIPYFPNSFYETKTGSQWESELREYDLLLPERQLQAIAAEQGVSFLGMGLYMQQSNVDTIQSLYLEDGVGHLTEAGHRYFAEALYECFYNTEASTPLGCIRE